MSGPAVVVESATLRAVAALNGRVRCPVLLYQRSDAERAIATDDFNVASASARSKFLDALAEEHRVEAAQLLEDLAAAVAAEGSKPRRRDAEGSDPFVVDEPWPELVDVAAVLDSLVLLVRAHLVLPSYGPEIVALWIAHTYVFAAADYTPYLLVTSPVRECGKSTLLDLLVNLAFRAQLTGGITAAALYRRIDRHSPAMLLDELDTRLRGDSGESLRGVLNTGFQRSGKVTLCVGDDHEEKDFSTFSPKVLAGIGRIWDTVASRSIPLRLNRATKDELRALTKIRGDRIGNQCLAYRRQLLRFAEDSIEALRVADAQAPEKLSARQCDVWRPLLAIADLAGEHWPETARAAALAVHSVVEEEGDYGLLLLQDLRSLYRSRNADVLASAAIVHALVEMEDRPWPEYRQGRELTVRGVAALLGRFEVHPKPHRFDGKLARGYALGQLQRVFDTYLPRIAPDVSVTSVTN